MPQAFYIKRAKHLNIVLALSNVGYVLLYMTASTN